MKVNMWIDQQIGGTKNGCVRLKHILILTKKRNNRANLAAVDDHFSQKIGKTARN